MPFILRIALNDSNLNSCKNLNILSDIAIKHQKSLNTLRLRELYTYTILQIARKS